MELKKSRNSIFTVRHSDLEEFIRFHYPGSRYRFTVDQNIRAVSLTHFERLFYIEKLALTEWDMKKLSNFRAGAAMTSMTRLALNDLCNRGLLEEGQYLVKINFL